MEYIIARGPDPDHLTTEVNRLMKDGWRVAGGAAFNNMFHLQAMTRVLSQQNQGGGSRRKKPTRRMRKTRRYRK